MSLHNHNPLNVNGARSYILLYEIYSTVDGNRVRLIAACRSFAVSAIAIQIEILTNIPQTVYVEQAHDYMQTFKANVIYKATLPQVIQFLYEKHIASATELPYDAIDITTKPGLYIDNSFTI